MTSLTLIVPVLLILLLLAGIIKMCVMLTDVVVDMKERDWFGRPERVMRGALAGCLLVVLAVLGGCLFKVLVSLIW